MSDYYKKNKSDENKFNQLFSGLKDYICNKLNQKPV